jgi:hypothetical protein
MQDTREIKCKTLKEAKDAIAAVKAATGYNPALAQTAREKEIALHDCIKRDKRKGCEYCPDRA